MAAVYNKYHQISVLLPDRTSIELKIDLPEQFPMIAPNLAVSPEHLQHRLIDSRMFVLPEASPKLQSWRPEHNLGQVVYSVVQKFFLEPPRRGSSSLSSSAKGKGDNRHSISMPAIPRKFPELENMKPAQLGELLNDDDAFRAFFNNLEGVRTMKKLRDDLKGAGKDTEVVALDAKIDTARVELASIKSLYDDAVKRQEAVMKNLSIPSLVEKLDDLALESEHETDDIARQFLDGNMDEKEFKRNFMNERILYHTRSAKKESLLQKMKK